MRSIMKRTVVCGSDISAKTIATLLNLLIFREKWIIATAQSNCKLCLQQRTECHRISMPVIQQLYMLASQFVL